jgi:predicted metal-binding membrane protein
MGARGSVVGAAIRADRTTLISGGVLLAVALAAWLALLVQQSAPTPMPSTPALADALAFLLAWGIMMVAMMLPSALPMITLYDVVQRNAAKTGHKSLPEAVFALVYVAVWVLIGVPIYLGSVVIAGAPQLEPVLPYALAAVLILAGVYQLTPLKRACLRVCRNPLAFFMARSRTGYAGSFALALEHAVYCVGCCWGLMVVLVAAGAMALNWVLLIAAIVFVEKALPRGEWTAVVTGAALVVLGLGVAARPDLAILLRPAEMGM